MKRKRLIVILCLLASSVWAVDNVWVSPTNGVSGTAGNWSLGHTPLASERVVFDAVAGSNTACTVNGNYNITSLLFTNSYTNTVNATIPNGFQITNGITFASAGDMFLLQGQAVICYGLDGLNPIQNNTTNRVIRFNQVGHIGVQNRSTTLTQDWSRLAQVNTFNNSANNGFDTNIKLLLSNIVVTVTNTGTIDAWVSMIEGSGISVSNATLQTQGISMARPTASITVNSGTLNVESVGNNILTRHFSAGSVSLNSSLLICASGSGGTVMTNFTYIATNSAVRITSGNSGSTFAFKWSPATEAANNSPVYLLSAISYSGVNHGTIIASNLVILIAATSSDYHVQNAASITLNGFTFSSTVTNKGIFIASNSTIVATDFINIGGTFSNMTSTVILAGNSNLTNLWNLQPNSPNASMTNATIRIFGTLQGAVGASLDVNNGTLVLSNAGRIYGALSNATVTGNPLTAGSTRNAGGKVNDLLKRGAE